MNNLYKNYMMMKGGKWIESAIKKPGSFTKQAQAAGMSVPGFRDKVLANKEDYSGTTVKRANLAKTLSRMKKGQGGMEFKDPMGADRSLMASEMTEPMAPSSSPLMGDEFEVEPSIAALDPNLDFARKDVASLEKQAERDNVRTYQRMLNQKYGAGLSEDGAWGPRTQAAYDKFIAGKKSKDGYWVDEMKAKMTKPTPETAQDRYEKMMADKRAAAAKKERDENFVTRMNNRPGSRPASKPATEPMPSQPASRPAITNSVGKVNLPARTQNTGIGLANRDFQNMFTQRVTPEMSAARERIASRRAANRSGNSLYQRSAGLNTNNAFRDFARTLVKGTPGPQNLKQVKNKK